MAQLEIKTPYIDMTEAAKSMAHAHNAIAETIAAHAAEAAAKRKEEQASLHALRVSQNRA